MSKLEPIPPKRYSLTVTCNIWDSQSAQGIGFNEGTTIDDGSFEKVLEILQAFHELTKKYTAGGGAS